MSEELVAINQDKVNDAPHNMSKKKQNDKDHNEKSDKEAEPAIPAVSLAHLYRFASKTDIVLIVIGFLAAVGSSLAFPIMLVLFGDVTNSFVGGGISTEELELIRCNATYAKYFLDSNET